MKPSQLIIWQKQIEQYLPSVLIPLDGTEPPIIKKLVKSGNSYISNGGKRLRPLLTLIGHSAGKRQNNTALLPIACLWELLHGFFLIQDDIMDKDESRRGKPSLHVELAKIHDNHQGESLAVLVSDLLFNHVTKVVIDSDWNNKQKFDILTLLQKTTRQVIHGQIADITNSNNDILSIGDIKYVNENKTAIYTFVAPLRLGANLSGASSGSIQGLHTIGMNLGDIFQMQDDLLNIAGDSSITGKPIGSDVREKKRTIIYFMAIELGNRANKRELLRIYNKDNITQKDINTVLSIFNSSGAIADISNSIIDKIEHTKVLIEVSKLPNSTKDYLNKIILLLTNRNN